MLEVGAVAVILVEVGVHCAAVAPAEVAEQLLVGLEHPHNRLRFVLVAAEVGESRLVQRVHLVVPVEQIRKLFLDDVVGDVFESEVVLYLPFEVVLVRVPAVQVHEHQIAQDVGGQLRRLFFLLDQPLYAGDELVAVVVVVIVVGEGDCVVAVQGVVEHALVVGGHRRELRGLK